MKEVEVVRLECRGNQKIAVLRIYSFEVLAKQDPLGRIEFEPSIHTNRFSEGHLVSQRILEKARREAYYALTNFNHPFSRSA